MRIIEDEIETFIGSLNMHLHIFAALESIRNVTAQPFWKSALRIFISDWFTKQSALLLDGTPLSHCTQSHIAVFIRLSNIEDFRVADGYFCGNYYRT